MSEKLEFFVGQMREAAIALEEAIAAADHLKLDGASIELRRALCDVNGVIWASECKEEAEFAPFRMMVSE